MKTKYCLSFKLLDFSQTGGAHPATFIKYFSFDLNTGKQLKLSDLIIEKKLDELNLLAEKKFRKNNNFTDTTDYQQKGYFVENGNLKLNNNFMVTPEGLSFLYNSYEIAPYSMGSTKIKLGKDEIKNFLKNNYYFKN